MADWVRENFRAENGKPFNEREVPWVTAPGGPCDAVDDLQFTRIWLQWAARMFKTTFGQGVQMKYAAVDPCPMMFATADETMCKQVLGRFWKMIAACKPLRSQCPAEHARSKHEVRLRRCMIHGAWAGGKSRLADKAIRVGHGNEISKWEHQQTSTEGDPLPRFLKRGDEFPDAKFILESTPSERGRCRVEHGLLQSTNCRYYVPCPHCGKFQKLTMGDGKESPGIFWQKNAAGKSEPEIAARTAYYVCAYCKGDIRSIHRPEMVNLGVWVPEGCGVDHDRAIRARELPPDDKSWLTGEPVRNGQDYGAQISSIYALFNDWGKVARKFLTAKLKVGELRQFINEDLAETFEVIQRKQTWEQLAGRWRTDRQRGIVPSQAAFLSLSGDVQQNHLVAAVIAWGPERTGWIVDYGTCDTWQQLEDEYLNHAYEYEDGEAVKVRVGCIDSGYDPDTVYQFCRRHSTLGRPLYPTKGGNLTGVPYRKSPITESKNKRRIGEMLTLVNTGYYQAILQRCIDTLVPGNPGSLAMCAGAAWEHQDFYEQLLNEASVDEIDSNNYDKSVWQKVNAHEPNDYRDTVRGGLLAYDIWTKGRPVRARVPGQGIAATKLPDRPRLKMPDGRPFFIGERR